MNAVKTKQFEKDFKALPIEIKELVADAYINVLNVKTIRDIANCEKLEGTKNRYRIKVKGYRILFLVVINGDTIEFRRVLPRGQVYKKHIKNN